MFEAKIIEEQNKKIESLSNSLTEEFAKQRRLRGKISRLKKKNKKLKEQKKQLEKVLFQLYDKIS